MHYTYYASDILESAMELAQVKAINSFSFRDCMNWLTEMWQYCYERIAQIDDGFYSETVQLTKKLTHMPPFVKNSVKVYAARHPTDGHRYPYKAASMTDLNTYGVYHISGYDLFCQDVEYRTIWLNYVPEPPFITFTKNNRDPKIRDDFTGTNPTVADKQFYGAYQLLKTPIPGGTTWTMMNRYKNEQKIDVTKTLELQGLTITALYCDHPYIFVSYRDDDLVEDPDAATLKYSAEAYSSYILKDILHDGPRMRFNPFDYLGHESHVEYLDAKWNDYTGMGVIVRDYNDKKRTKELGWTPDTIMNYPSPIMRNYLVANLARKFADLNGSQLQAVENEVASTNYQMSNFLSKDKSAWFRPDRVVGRTLSDIL